MKLLSVNVGRPRPNPWRGGREPDGWTGIDKRPVEGAVAVAAPGAEGTGEVGLAGDRVYDVAHHGGADQAVYAYAREDLDRWQRELGRPLGNGAFGENLTTVGVDVNGALIGERWRVGADVVLEVSCPRIPCGTFQGWMGLRGWNRRFTQAGLPGAYLRVITPGEIRAGDPVAVVRRPAHGVSVAYTFRAVTTEAEWLPSLLEVAELPAFVREFARGRVERRRGRGGRATE
ncbi:MOSC domain-containing protein [Streptomyces catenulae]|uniref:MOSC domain-containing protein n=1 Tax=Streptomyces catenulae TaxID=66875 RepID=A0ABV2Z3Q2_9ACTN|nr:MOSC domain-containing protein [Streptomyces catenulae]